MDPSNAQHQDMATHTHSMEDVLACPKSQQEKKVRPQPEQALKCPRCDSTNTKFCYYNNYSLSQPRYFCKACRRYWTKGGSLRNIPVGGVCRKNKRSSSSKRPQDQALTTNSTPLPTLPSLTYDSNELSLAFARLHKQPTRQFGLDDPHTSIFGNSNTIHCDILGNHDTSNNNITTPTTTASFLDAMRSGLFDAPSVLHNYYHGFGNGNIGDVEGLGGVEEEVVLPFEEMGGGVTTTMATTITTKQGSCKGGEMENKVFWGMQWPLSGDENMVNDSGRDSWNGIGSSWYGLVNGPLV